MYQILESIDVIILFWINQSLSNPIFDLFMPLITNKDNWIVPIIALILYLIFYNGKRGRITLIILIISLGLTDAVSAQLLKPYFSRIRPSHELSLIHI